MRRTNPRPLESVMEAIRTAKSFALVSHVNPDGDTVGSVLALRQGLLQLGRPVTLFCQDKIPDDLAFLPGAEGFRLPENIAEGEQFDLLMCVDVSDESRMGRCASLMKLAKHTAQVDHHGTNPNFCEANCVDGTATACALIVKELLERLGCTITPEIAKCLYVATCTDSGQFSFPNTTAEAFDAMGDLMRTGFDLSGAHRKIYRERDPRQIKLLGRALNTLAFHHNGQIVSLQLTKEDMQSCNALPEHTDTIVNVGLDMAGVRMCVFARETSVPGTVKCSLRAVEPAAVDKVALAFGGGGHAQAAGCTLQMTVEEAVAAVVSLMEAELEKEE
ncbi:MAG: DHH family phosphoesterase [Clostridia bacterium]|nr:DHH family phosphoesterase [Clostridia bacterium]